MSEQAFSNRFKTNPGWKTVEELFPASTETTNEEKPKRKSKKAKKKASNALFDRLSRPTQLSQTRAEQARASIEELEKNRVVAFIPGGGRPRSSSSSDMSEMKRPSSQQGRRFEQPNLLWQVRREHAKLIREKVSAMHQENQSDSWSRNLRNLPRPSSAGAQINAGISSMERLPSAIERRLFPGMVSEQNISDQLEQEETNESAPGLVVEDVEEEEEQQQQQQ